MGWADHAKEALLEGRTVQVKPRGNSMSPLVDSGDTVTLEPAEMNLSVGDIVLARVRGRDYLHKITAINGDGRFQIGNNRGHSNGWVGESAIYGRVITVEA